VRQLRDPFPPSAESAAVRTPATAATFRNPPATLRGMAVTTPESPATREPTIRASGLGRRFGEAWAVRGLTFEVRPGEVLGLLGPNGAGKTTTVRMLTALIGPTEGDAWVEGHDVRHDAEAVRAKVGVLTETPGLYEKLSARANLEFFGRLHQLPADVRAERIRRLLTLFDLWDRRDDAAGTFSKGMKQKLAIARALLHEPAVLFLDEPTAALDPEAAFIVRDAISRLRSAGRTIVLATHNLDEANRLCDRIAFIRGGLLRIDSPARLREAASGGLGVEIVFDQPASDALLTAARQAPAVRGVEALNGKLTVGLDDPRRDTPGLVRALVNAGAGIVEVRERAASLEDVYFEVMGVRPGVGGEVD
jgi:ABC-2 type transport system ATP-binding protein